ncbi:MAG: envelope stress response membrane protein PspC [Gammaproteobacteria bacterium]|nr:envelope stress response membrane protein PspC [Gammaproteobacteria bacterium]
MKRDRYDRDRPRRNKLYRNSEDGVIAGVCAGVADYFGFDLTITRVLVVISALFFTVFTVFLYLVLAILLPKRPPELSRSEPDDDELDKRMRAEPHASLHTIRHRFREIDRRLQNIERYVTSKRFKLDREFEGLNR